MKKSILSLGAALLLAGCFEHNKERFFNHDSFVVTPAGCNHTTLTKGMNVEEVTAFCGLPYERNNDTYSSQWVYNVYGPADPMYVYFSAEGTLRNVQWSTKP